MVTTVLHLAMVFMRMFLRDRRAMLFSLFFPIILLSVLGFLRDRPPPNIEIAVANHADSAAATKFLGTLDANPMFTVKTDDEALLRERLLAGEESLVLVIPQDFEATTSTELVIYVDAAQVRLITLIMPTLEKALVDVERTLRKTEPMFSLRVEDVQSRSQQYIDFLLPGILAFSLMQISIAGSGFNIVEYRRKGILKRLFVTPIRPAGFIASLCLARLAWCLLQLTSLMIFAVYVLDVTILGSYFSLYLVLILGSIIFLCLGFCVGSVARTQQAVGAMGSIVIFPQLILSGAFFPIDLMPDPIQPVANLLPLSYVVSGLRGIASSGLGIIEVAPSLLGVFAWIAITFLMATRLFVWKEVVST